MIRKLIVNPDYFKLSTEQVYTMLCKKIQEKKKNYEIYSADGAGIQFLKGEKESHITKEEMMKVLSEIKKSHELSLKIIPEKNKAIIIDFLIAADVVY